VPGTRTAPNGAGAWHPHCTEGRDNVITLGGVEPPALEDVYEPAVVRAIDGDLASRRRAERGPAPTSRGFGSAAASVALTTALVTGVREVLEPDANEVYEEIDDGIVGGPTDAVTLFFVPNNQWSTRAVVRPWLFPAAAESGVAS